MSHKSTVIGFLLFNKARNSLASLGDVVTLFILGNEFKNAAIAY